MKTRIYTIIVLWAAALFCTNINAQPWMRTPYLNSSDENNIKRIEEAFNNYWQSNNPNVKGSGYKQGKRYIEYLKYRADKNGNLPNQMHYINEYAKVEALNSDQKSTNANWTAMGPFNTPGVPFTDKVVGIGRVNCVEIHPTDTNIIWAGTASSGVWKTTNGGQSWIQLNMEGYPNCGVSDIAVNPLNPNIIYVATGDSKIGMLKSYGVLKTTDGGNTWSNTTPFFLNAGQLIYRLMIHPANPDIVYMSCSWNKMYRTFDAGANWSYVISSSGFRDMQFKPGNLNVIYGIDGAGQFYKSTDAGDSFTHVTSGLPSSGASNSVLAVTPANPNVVYAHITATTTNNTLGIYKSVNSGDSWTLMNSSVNLVHEAGTFNSNSLGWYTLFIAVSPLNADDVSAGGMHVFRSTNGGSTFNLRTKYNLTPETGVVHGFKTDVHSIKFMPNSGTMILSTDGGVYKVYHNSTSFVELNNNLMISQIYRFGASENYPNLLYAGLQDNSVLKYSNATWSNVVVGDGMESVIDFTDPNIVYMTVQNGYMFKSNNGGQTYFNCAPQNQSGNGAWEIPFIMNPAKHLELLAGYREVFRTINGGNSWTQITNNQAGGSEILGLSCDNTGNTIYFNTSNKVFKTTNGGSAWTEITGTLPVSEAFVWKVYANPASPNEVWAIFGGTANGKKVYKSSNGGATWDNISFSLPNVKINCIQPDFRSSVGAVYVGTDLGVFYMDNTTSNDWVGFNTSLPIVAVTDLEINHKVGKLRASTFGRGMWETNIETNLSEPQGLPCDMKINFPEVNHDSYTVFSSNGNAGAATECAELMTADASYSHVMGAAFRFSKATTNNPTTAKITVKIWSNDGANGKPGTVLAQKDVLISTIAQDINNMLATEVVFNTPVSVSGQYYIGYSSNYIAGDTIGIKSTWYGATATNTAFVKTGGTWSDYMFWGTLAMNVSAMTGKVPTPGFSASATTGNPGAVINFINNTTSGTEYLWRFQGGIPATSIDENPSVTYSTAGTFNVTLVSFGNCGAKDSIVRNSYITIGTQQQYCYKKPALTGNFSTTGVPVANSIAAGNITINGATLNGSVNANGAATAVTFEYGQTISYGNTIQATPGNVSGTNLTSVSAAVTGLTPGTQYHFRVKAVNSNGTRYGNDLVFTTGSLPVVAFTANTTTIVAGASVNFTDHTTNAPTSWMWTFEGGTPATSNIQNPSGIVYNTPGTYRVKLRATNNFGTDSLIRLNYITVNPAGIAPVANFTASQTVVTAGNSINFTDNSANSPTSWSWTFEGGTPATSNVQNPTGVYYNTPGTYTVTLVATNAFGTNTKTRTAYITVNPAGFPPVANFTASLTNIVAGSSINFTDNSTNNPTTWSWTFEGGTPATSNVQNPIGIVYSSPGTYTVTLVAGNAFGNNTKVKTGYIIVTPAGNPPVANFTASQTVITAGATINFTDNTTNNPTSWSWTFTGATPNTSNVQNPAGVQYNTPGTYTVTLVATNSFGSNTKTKTAYITVNPAGTPPVANFTANTTSILAGGSVSFTDNSSGGPASWSWTFDGGTPATSNLQNPSGIVYANAGTYSVTLVSTNAFGSNTKIKTGYIVVDPAGYAPVASFTSDLTYIAPGSSINFSDLSTNNPTSWAWTFTGGTPSSSNSQNPTGVSYSAAGTYTVQLIASNAFGTDTIIAQDYIVVANPPINCDTLLYPITGTLSCSYANGNNNYGDLAKANVYTTTGNELSGVYMQFCYVTGTGDATVAIWDNSGASGSPGAVPLATQTVSLSSIINDINIGQLTYVQFPSSVPVTSTFYAGVILPTAAGDTAILVSNSNGDTNPGIAWEKWYDDTWYAFSDPSSWSRNVALAVYPIVCGTSSVVAKPSANFSSSTLSVSEGGTVDFYDNSANSPTSWEWTFTGGTPSTSNSQNPIGVVYSTAGSYDVKLVATNAGGSDTIIKTAYINVEASGTLPYADFTADNVIINEGESVQFTDLSTGTPSSWSWSFEGGSPSASSSQNPLVTYNTAGVYFAKLVVYNAFGADSAIYSNYITVNSTSSLYADFTSDYMSVNEGDSVHFYDYSYGSPTSWEWFMDGATPSYSTDQNPAVAYYTAGTYNVMLVVSDGINTDTVNYDNYITVSQVGSSLYADFSSDQYYIQEGSQVQFNDLSTGNPTSWEWHFAGGTPSVSYSQNPLVTYSAEGSYSVKLIVSDGINADSVEYADYIYVYGGSTLLADFTADNTYVAEGTTVNFTDLSSGNPTSWNWTFDGGLPQTSTSQNPSVVYNTSGTYNVKLVVSDGLGSDSVTYTGYVYVYPVGYAPVVDFSSDVTTVTEGGSVNFYDISSNTPTLWTWYFEGGNPSTSTAQNPTITYSTAGNYYVKLVAANSYGTDSITKTAYITVNQSTAVNANDTLNYPLTGTLMCSYANGNNNYGDLAKANVFSVSGSNTQVLGVLMNFCYATGSGNASVSVWDNSGTGGSPGAIPLATEQLAISTVITNINSSSGTYVQFSSPVNVSSDYYVGVTLPTVAGDTLILVSNSNGDTNPGIAWEQWYDNTWYPFSDASSWNRNIALAIHPLVSYEPVGVAALETGKKPILIYPNPTSGNLNIENAEDCMIKVMNIVGEELIQYNSTHALTKMDVSHLSKGTYLIQIISKEKCVTKKITIDN